MNNEQLDIYDVVAIGAGPVGLATAVGLQQRGIDNILVIDRTSSFRPAGSNIDLLPNGLKALKSIATDAYRAVKSTGNVFANHGAEKTKITPEWIYKNIKGEVLRSIPLSFDRWMETYGEGRVSINWYDLQTTLRQLLPESKVKANHRCVNVVRESDTGYVRVECTSNMPSEANPYAYWWSTLPNTPNQQSSQTKTIRAKLVVAADGINSTVRRVLYGDSSYTGFQRPQYSGYAAVGCLATTDIPGSLAEELHQTFLKNLPIVTLFNNETSDFAEKHGPRVMLFRRGEGQFGYIIHHAIPLTQLEGQTGEGLIDLGMEVLEEAQFPEAIANLVKLSPSGSMFQRPYYIHPVTDSLSFPETANGKESGDGQPPWSDGRIVLAGDAAHGMPPFMAQGTNQGFEDALCLVRLIAHLFENNLQDDLGAIAKAFGEYEQIRRPIMEDIQQATLSGFYQDVEEWESYNQRIYHRDFPV